MAGNVREWNDLTAVASAQRGLRGGAWSNTETSLRSSTRNLNGPAGEGNFVGFRVATVPEPSTMVLTVLFSAGMLARRKR